MQFSMIDVTALFKPVLDVVMANSQWYGEKHGHSVQLCSLPAGLYQQAANTLGSFLKLDMIKKKYLSLRLRFHLYQLLWGMCGGASVLQCLCIQRVCVCVHVGKWSMCVTVTGFATSITSSHTGFN